MIIPIRGGEWNQWVGRQDEEYFARLLNGFGWQVAVRNRDYRRIAGQPDDLSVDTVASFWDPVLRRLEAVFVEAKRRTERPTPQELHSWIEKCRKAQEFVEATDEIQGLLCHGTETEAMPCNKSVLFLDCDRWPDVWGEQTPDTLPIQKRTSGPPRRVTVVDQRRALWLQHSLDVLGVLRNPQNQAPELFKVYHWKRGFHENLPFDGLTSEVRLFEVAYPGETQRELVLVTYEALNPETAGYYSDHLVDMLDAGAHGVSRIVVYHPHELDPQSKQAVEQIVRTELQKLRADIGVDVRVRTLPQGLDR